MIHHYPIWAHPWKSGEVVCPIGVDVLHPRKTVQYRVKEDVVYLLEVAGLELCLWLIFLLFLVAHCVLLIVLEKNILFSG